MYKIKAEKWEWFKSEGYLKFGYSKKGQKCFKSNDIMAIHITKSKIEPWQLTHIENVEEVYNENIKDLILAGLVEKIK